MRLGGIGVGLVHGTGVVGRGGMGWDREGYGEGGARGGGVASH